jgi:hypothetical protein
MLAIKIYDNPKKHKKPESLFLIKYNFGSTKYIK